MSAAEREAVEVLRATRDRIHSRPHIAYMLAHAWLVHHDYVHRDKETWPITSDGFRYPPPRE